MSSSFSYLAGGARLLLAFLSLFVLAACGPSTPQELIDSAKAYLAKHDGNAAVIQLKNALQKAPDNAEARYLLGTALLENGDPLSAEKELRRARELNFSSDLVAAALSRAMLETGDNDGVVSEFAELALTSPQAKADVGASLGYAYLGLRRPEDAAKAFSDALAAVPGHAHATLGKARMLAARNDLDGAGKLVDQVLTASPALVDAQFLKAELLTVRGDNAGAGKMYDGIIAAHPSNLRAHYRRIVLSLSQQQLDAAEGQLEALKKVAPGNGQTLYLQALLALKRSDLRAAREAVQQVLKMAPQYIPAQLLAGEVEYRLGSFAEAERHLKRVLAAAPDDAAARRLLTGVYLDGGQPAPALEMITPLLNKNTTDSRLLMLAGDVFMRNRNVPEAKKYFSQAVALEQGNVLARTRLGQTLFVSGDAALGMQELEAASDLDKSQFQADVLLVVAHLKRREVEQALAAVAKLESKQPKNPLTFYLRAAAMMQKDDIAACRKNLERALELDPAYFPAALSLASLDAREQKWDAAKQRFEGLLAKDPKHTGALLALAQLRAVTGSPGKDVISLIERAIAANPTAVPARLAQVRHYLAAQDAHKALAAAQEAQAALPDNVAILDVLALAQQAKGDINQAISTYTKIASLRPKAPEPLVRRAALEWADKRGDKALQTLRDALVLRPDFVDAQFALIAIQTTLGRPDAALAVAKDIQRQRPTEAAGYIAEGEIYGLQKNWPQAAAVYRAALAKLNKRDLAIKLHGALIESGRAAEAEKISADWLKANPKDGVFRVYIAERRLAAKEYRAAVEQYQVLLTNNPKDTLALNNLAWALGQLKDPKAIDYAERARALAPNSPAILDTLAMIMLDRGDKARAVELLRQALMLAPNAHTIRMDLATALARSGQQEGARRELEPLLKLDDKDPAHIAAAALMRSL